MNHNFPNVISSQPDVAVGSLDMHTNWRFIDRQTYSQLKESRHALPLNDFINLWHKGSDASKHLSESSHDYIVLIDDAVKGVLFDVGVCRDAPLVLNYTYLQMQAKAYLNEEVEDNAPFYEILPIDNQNHLVVLSRGFLHHVTQSKDNLHGFVLACLRCLDHFNCTTVQLNQLYLRLNYVKDYILLIQNKTQC